MSGERWSPELEILDQLIGGSLPLPVIVGLFKNVARATNAIGIMLQKGELVLLDADNIPVSVWRWREISSSPDFPELQYRIDITQQGLKKIHLGQE